MKLTLQQIEEISKNKELERKRVKLCIKNNVCPECGAEIISCNYEKYDKPKKYLFGLITCNGTLWDIRKVCKNDKSHYEFKDMCLSDMEYQ